MNAKRLLGFVLCTALTAALSTQSESAAGQKPAPGKGVPKDDGKPLPGSGKRVHISNLTYDKNLPADKMAVTEIGVVAAKGKTTTLVERLTVTKDTKFVVVDGKESKTYNQKTVLEDPAIPPLFRERLGMVDRKGDVVVTVTVTATK